MTEQGEDAARDPGSMLTVITVRTGTETVVLPWERVRALVVRANGEVAVRDDSGVVGDGVGEVGIWSVDADGLRQLVASLGRR